MSKAEIISEGLWDKVKLLLPKKEKAKGHGGRKPSNLKSIFSGIICEPAILKRNIMCIIYLLNFLLNDIRIMTYCIV